MKNSAALIAASLAALVAAQDVGQVCKAAGEAYCAGDSLGTDIIIRCSGAGVGQPGRCSNNLVGQPPVGNFPSRCFQSSKEAGDAACEKNCIVYAEPSFSLKDCTPTFTASTGPSGTGSQSPTGVTQTSASQTGGSQQPSKPLSTSMSSVTGSSPSTGCHKCSHTSTTGTGPSVVPTAGAAANHIGGGVLAIVGLVVGQMI